MAWSLARTENPAGLWLGAVKDGNSHTVFTESREKEGTVHSGKRRNEDWPTLQGLPLQTGRHNQPGDFWTRAAAGGFEAGLAVVGGYVGAGVRNTRRHCRR